MRPFRSLPTLTALLAVLLAATTTRAAAEPAPPGIAGSEVESRHGAGPLVHDAPAAPLAALPPAPDPRLSAALLPAAAALVPGLLLHGAGPFAAGDRRAGYTLLAMEGAGLAAVAAGMVPIALSGASRRVIAPLSVLTVAGAALFTTSAVANLYGALSPAFSPGASLDALPPLELELGYQAVAGEAFDHHHLLTAGALGRIGRLRLAGTGWVAAASDHQRVRLSAAWRFFGPQPAPEAPGDGTFLELEGEAGTQRFGPERFLVSTVGAGLRGRGALGRLGPSLRGAFAELAAGYALQPVHYRGLGTDLQDMLLAEFGFGVFFGREGTVRGEAMAFYSHRRDEYAGALRGFSGVPGFFGLRSRVHLSGRWGVSGELTGGNALSARITALYFFGGDR